MTLNAAQHMAVMSDDSLALVACPGSGKTRTLVEKLLACSRELGDSTRVVGCITYTNAAVQEIESRLSRVGRREALRAEVETIHSFCMKHLLGPHHWRLAPFARSVAVLAPEDPLFKELVADVRREFDLSAKASDGFEMLARGTGKYPESVPQAAAEAFWARLDARATVDFGGIVYWSRRLVEDFPYIARGTASRYAWLLVDEFQDTTESQYEILLRIFRFGRTRVWVVGDPEQAIMSFAGARSDLMDKFVATTGARNDIKLAENYRASNLLVAMAERLSPRSPAMVGVGPNARFASVPQWFAVESMLSGVADHFLPEVRRFGIPLSDTAVLASWWMSLLPLARGLRDLGIPVVGPGARPYKKPHHIVAGLIEECAAAASEQSGIVLPRLAKELRTLLERATGINRRDLGFRGDVICMRIVRELGRDRDPDELADSFIRRIVEFVANALLYECLVTARERAVIVEAATALCEDIVRNEARYERGPTLVSDLGIFGRGSDSMKLLTMHKSKGREFDAVALIDVFDGHVPHYTAVEGGPVEAEGRRLLYVACTRARKCFMAFTLRDADFRKRPSRFLPAVFPAGAARA